jgi:SAM-dependent methyltransferase
MSSYTLNNDWQLARRRLGLLETRLDPITQARLAGLGVGPGWRCLEVGGGLGSVARWLGERVTLSGQVTVTDIDTRFLEEIERPNVRVWRHDITVDDLPAEAFDLIHLRWLLYHLPAPEAVCQRLCRALRPGGWLVLEDVDFFPIFAASPASFVRFMVRLAEVVGGPAGHDGFWAARALPAMLVEPSLTDLKVEAGVDVLEGGTAMAEFWRLTAEQMRPALHGSEDLCRLDQAVALLRDPAFWTFSVAHVGAWARRAPVAR